MKFVMVPARACWITLGVPASCNVQADGCCLCLCRSELTDGDIRTAIKNSGGVKGSLLIPEAPFELLVRRAIGRLLTPSLQCKEARTAANSRLTHRSTGGDVLPDGANVNQSVKNRARYVLPSGQVADGFTH